MRLRPASVAAAFALSTLAVTGLAAPAVAQTPICDPYSETCSTPPPPTTPPPLNVVRDRDCVDTDEDCIPTTTTSVDNTVATLPFTGGELVLLTTVGAGALAGGVALVVAGRRRKGDLPA